jgi:hypothetical protein
MLPLGNFSLSEHTKTLYYKYVLVTTPDGKVDNQVLADIMDMVFYVMKTFSEDFIKQVD